MSELTLTEWRAIVREELDPMLDRKLAPVREAQEQLREAQTHMANNLTQFGQEQSVIGQRLSHLEGKWHGVHSLRPSQEFGKAEELFVKRSGHTKIAVAMVLAAALTAAATYGATRLGGAAPLPPAAAQVR
jgi:molybdopterin-biosynthesis enzyme MoeA-like protein